MKEKNLHYLNYQFMFSFTLLIVFSNLSVKAQDKEKGKSTLEHIDSKVNETISDTNYYRDLFSDTWVASDAIGRKMPNFEEVGSIKKERLAFFILHGIQRIILPIIKIPILPMSQKF